tara:strand:+ start:1410 stop:2750 length:1341 start_codon:yes stop_codon:yes gene_type:complete
MRVLIVDDEEDLLNATVNDLREDGHSVVGATTGTDALSQLDQTYFDLVLLDLQLPDADSFELLSQLQDSNPNLDIVVVTPADGMQTAVEALRLGALDWITAPFTSDQVRVLLNRISRNRQLRGRLSELELQVNSDLPPFSFNTTNPVMTGALEVAAKAANSPASILLQGENGTGKSVFARFIHENSDAADQAFVTVSCPSLSPQLLASELFGYVRGAFTGAVKDTWGKVAQADGGTLFLDEIGELSLDLQPKLLRLLQERQYERVGETQTHQANIRLIAATNINLEDAVRSGTFREDLLYRLNVINLTMPPLRERPGDILELANSYLTFFAKQCRKPVKGFSAKADRALLRYSWPGNLRELRNYVERAVIMAERELIELEDLPSKLSPTRKPRKDQGILGQDVSLENVEKEHIKLVCARHKTKDEAARVLGIDKATLYRKRRRYRI